MSPSNPSDASINELLHGGRLSSGKTLVGPLRQNAIRLLRVLWDSRSELARKKGTDQVTALRQAYLAAIDNPSLTVDSSEGGLAGLSTLTESSASGSTPVNPRKPRWRLLRLRCQSIRGVAPISTTFEFSFDGSPTLLYGPNGSGKSSLLNAIGWVLTKRVVTDCDDDAEVVPLYAPPKGTGRAAKLCDWPVVHTLPHGADPCAASPDCWAELWFRSEDGLDSLHLRRTLRGDLEESDNGITWRPCPFLGRHGISPLDLQLSVSAATVFGRRSIEASSDTCHLLSMMLGYDALEELGGFATTLATNLTKAAKAEREVISISRERLRAKLIAQPARLRENLPLRGDVVGLVGDELPSQKRIADMREVASTKVREAEEKLASLLGIRTDGGVPPGGLADSLAAAVSATALR